MGLIVGLNVQFPQKTVFREEQSSSRKDFPKMKCTFAVACVSEQSGIR